MPIICIAGLFGNIAAMIAFGKPKRSQKNFFTFMFYLALFDFVYIIAAILLFILPHLSDSYVNDGPWYYIVPSAIPVGQISMTGSVHFTTAITVERYLTVCHPFYMVSRNLSAKPISVGIMLFSFLYNLPKFFEMSTTYELCHYNQTSHQGIHTMILSSQDCEAQFYLRQKINSFPYEPDSNANLTVAYNMENTSISLDGYGIQPSNLRFNSIYVQVYTVYSNLLVNGAVPFVLVIVLNILIVANLQDTKLTSPPERRREGKKMLPFMI